MNLHRCVFFIANPVAGGGAVRAIKKAENIIKNKGIDVHLKLTAKKGDAELFAREISSQLTPNLIRGQSSQLIIVGGGDGTLNEVINGLLSRNESIPTTAEKKGILLAILPLGITNVLAKELGIPEDVEKATHLALTGTHKKVSLGRINGKFFASMAGIGFDGEAVFRLNEKIKKISGKGAHILSGINCLRRYNPPLIEVRTSEGIFTGYTAVVGKAGCYGGYFKVTPHASLTEPVLDLCLFKGRTRRDLIRFVIGVLRKRHLNFKDVFYEKFSELEISSKGQVHIQIDGEYFGTLPVRIDVVKDAVSLIW